MLLLELFGLANYNLVSYCWAGHQPGWKLRFKYLISGGRVKAWILIHLC